MYKRHDLLYFSIDARKEVLSTLKEINEDMVNIILNKNIPAIVSRQEFCKENHIQCGFTSPKIYENGRFRIGLELLKSNIERHYTPFQLINNAKIIPKEKIVFALIELGEQTGFNVGFFGSFAMEIITGIKYTNEKSDIDIYIRGKSENLDFIKFYNGVLQLEKKFNIKIDGEIEIKEVFGVKIKEICSKQKTVLAKGINSVEIISKEEICLYN